MASEQIRYLPINNEFGHAAVLFDLVFMLLKGVTRYGKIRSYQ
jgi:hypothetical protein